jgi:aspartyl-tRNA(Asn)/glutamyl-tRNA(Gln) amidotransferase subunit A
MSLTLKEYITGVHNGSLDHKKILLSYLEKAKMQDTYNAFVRIHDDYVNAHGSDLSLLPLAWAPIGMKDIFMTKWYETTCCSKILQWYIPGYSSSVFEKLEQAWWCMIGKTNMDEFAMGASNETSCFGVVKNPHDESRIAGGSSGWSAAAVAADLCLWAFATDTWWSIRLPAALCGIVWVKATYGRTSRYGVQAMASSLDHIGVLTKTVEDAVILMSAVSGQDDHDATSIPFTEEEQQSRNDALSRSDLNNKKIAVPKQFFNEWMDPDVKKTCLETIAYLESQWASVDRIDLPIVDYAVPTYYIITPAEVSTNMARFDGIRFGLQWNPENFESLHHYYANIRAEWFGSEVKRRILTGAYVLSAWFYDAYYRKALAVRAQMRRDFAKIFNQYDAVVSPTSPEVAWKIGEKINDPVKMYLADIYTAIANLVGNPAMSVPCGWVEKDGKKLPVGFQIMTWMRDEATMFGIGRVVERKEMERK